MYHFSILDKSGDHFKSNVEINSPLFIYFYTYMKVLSIPG